MTYINASYQTGLQLLMAAGAASNSGSDTSAGSGTSASVGAGTTVAGSTTQSSSASANSLDGYSASGSISALKAVASAANGPQARVMAAIVAALSTKGNYYQNDTTADSVASQAISQMSSQQLSDTLLNGGALATGLNANGSTFRTESMADMLNSIKSAIASTESADSELSQWVQGGMSSSNSIYGKSSLSTLSSDQINGIIASNNQSNVQAEKTLSSITGALANGTLKIQKASDVQGLDYKNAVDTYAAIGTTGESFTENRSAQYNESYIKSNAESGALTGIGSQGIYLSW